MKLEDINDYLDRKLESDDYDSIGGLIIENLDRLPSIGESVMTKEGILLKVAEMNQNRIEKVYMVLPQLENSNTTSPN